LNTHGNTVFIPAQVTVEHLQLIDGLILWQITFRLFR